MHDERKGYVEVREEGAESSCVLLAYALVELKQRLLDIDGELIRLKGTLKSRS